MKNTTQDLNNYLFESLERLLDDELDEEELQREMNRSKSICAIAEKIIDNADLTLRTMQFLNESGIEMPASSLPKLLGVKNEVAE